MIMTDDYRLVEQGGITFRNIKPYKRLSDLRRGVIYARLAVTHDY